MNGLAINFTVLVLVIGFAWLIAGPRSKPRTRQRLGDFQFPSKCRNKYHPKIDFCNDPVTRAPNVVSFGDDCLEAFVPLEKVIPRHTYTQLCALRLIDVDGFSAGAVIDFQTAEVERLRYDASSFCREIEDFQTIRVHPLIYAKMRKENMIDHAVQGYGNVTTPMYMCMEVVVDHDMTDRRGFALEC